MTTILPTISYLTTVLNKSINHFTYKNPYKKITEVAFYQVYVVSLKIKINSTNFQA